MPRPSCTFTRVRGDAYVAPTKVPSSVGARHTSPLFFQMHCWVRGDACVAPTKVPSSVGARHASPLFFQMHCCVKGDACVAPTKVPCSNPALLFRLEAGVLDHLAPLAELDLDEIPELLGRA